MSCSADYYFVFWSGSAEYYFVWNVWRGWREPTQTKEQTLYYSVYSVVHKVLLCHMRLAHPAVGLL
jgi:hypothetical protein